MTTPWIDLGSTLFDRSRRRGSETRECCSVEERRTAVWGESRSYGERRSRESTSGESDYTL